jgi:hypothetical protein
MMASVNEKTLTPYIFKDKNVDINENTHTQNLLREVLRRQRINELGNNTPITSEHMINSMHHANQLQLPVYHNNEPPPPPPPPSPPQQPQRQPTRQEIPEERYRSKTKTPSPPDSPPPQTQPNEVEDDYEPQIPQSQQQRPPTSQQHFVPQPRQPNFVSRLFHEMPQQSQAPPGLRPMNSNQINSLGLPSLRLESRRF